MKRGVFYLISILLLLTSQTNYAAFRISRNIQPQQDSTRIKLSQNKTDSNNKAKASLICGIVGVFILQFVLGPLAIVYGVKGMGKGKPYRGQAIAGFVLGILDTILGAVILLFVLSGF